MLLTWHVRLFPCQFYDAPYSTSTFNHRRSSGSRIGDAFLLLRLSFRLLRVSPPMTGSRHKWQTPAHTDAGTAPDSHRISSSQRLPTWAVFTCDSMPYSIFVRKKGGISHSVRLLLPKIRVPQNDSLSDPTQRIGHRKPPQSKPSNIYHLAILPSYGWQPGSRQTPHTVEVRLRRILTGLSFHMSLYITTQILIQL